MKREGQRERSIAADPIPVGGVPSGRLPKPLVTEPNIVAGGYTYSKATDMPDQFVARMAIAYQGE